MVVAPPDCNAIKFPRKVTWVIDCRVNIMSVEEILGHNFVFLTGLNDVIPGRNYDWDFNLAFL